MRIPHVRDPELGTIQHSKLAASEGVVDADVPQIMPSSQKVMRAVKVDRVHCPSRLLNVVLRARGGGCVAGTVLQEIRLEGYKHWHTLKTRPMAISVMDIVDTDTTALVHFQSQVNHACRAFRKT